MAIEWNKPVRKLKWRAKQLDKTTHTTTQTFINLNHSFEVQRVAEDTKFFGQVICQKLNLKMRPTETYNYTVNDYWRLSFSEGGSDYEEHFPYFYTTEVHTDENTGDKSITAYDWIKNLENHTFNELNINPPYTIRQVAEAITHFDSTKRNTVFTNIDENTLNLTYSQGANLNGDEKLVDILSMIAEVCGAVCFVNSENMLEFKRLDKDGEPVLEITKNDYFKLKSGDNKRLAKIIYATELGDNVEAHTTAIGSTQVCRNNAFLDNRADRMALVTTAINTYGGLTIGQVDLDWRANLDLEIGDKIAIAAKDDSTITTYLLDEVIKWDNGLNSKIRFKWDGTKESDEHANPATIGDAFNSTYAKVDKINNRIDLVVADQESTNQELSGVKNDLTNTKTQVTTNKNNIASLTLTTNGLEVDVNNLENRVETAETSISNISVGGRNLFIAKTRTNNKYIRPEDGALGNWNKGFVSDWIAVEPSTSYILQIWQIPKTQEQIEAGVETSWALACYDENKVWISPRNARTISDKSYDTYTKKMPATAHYARIQWHIGGDFDASKWNPYGDYKIKFEKGNKPTDWSIAPEDIYGAITTITEDTNTIRADLTSTQTQVETNKQDIASLDVTTQGITADVQNLESKTDTTNTKVASIESNVSGITTSLNETKTQVATNKQDIANLSVTTDGISANVQNLETTTQNITNTISSLTVGGRNLFIASRRTNNIQPNGTSWAKSVLSDFVEVKEGDKLILQAWKPANTSATGYDRGYIIIGKYKADKTFIDIVPGSGGRTPDNTSYFTGDYYWFKYTVEANVKYVKAFYHFGVDGPAGEDWNPYSEFQVMLEKGSMPSAWSIAPEDIQAGIISLQDITNTLGQTIETTQTQVETNKQDIAALNVSTEGISANVQSLQSTTTTLTNTVANIQVGGRNLYALTAPTTYLPNGGFGLSITAESDGWIRVKGTSTRTGSATVFSIFGSANDFLDFPIGDYCITVENDNVLSPGMLRVQTNYTKNGSNGWAYHDGTTEVIKLQNVKINYTRLYLYAAANGTTFDGRFRVKLEQGNIPTGWSVAPEDIDSDISVIKTDIATTQTQVQTNKEDIASLEVTTNGISQTVSNHTSSINSMNTTLSTVQTTANNAKDKADTLETNLNSVSSQVTTNKNNIATLQTTTSGITASVSDLQTAQQTLTTTVDNLSVGGRNLFIAKTRTNNKYVNTSGSEATWGKTILSDYIPVEASKKYIIQIWQPAYDTSDNDEKGYWNISAYNSSKTWVKRYLAGTYFTSNYQKMEVTIDATGIAYLRISYHFGVNGPQGADWNPYGQFKIKVEQGTMPTGWSIAPEDVDENIAAAQAKADAAQGTADGVRADLTTTQAQVATNKSDIASLKVTTTGISATVSSLDSTTTTLTNTVSGLRFGGRNLLLNTATPKTSPASASNSAYTDYWAESAYSKTITPKNTTDDFTVSFDFEITGNSETDASIYYQWVDIRGNAPMMEVGTDITSGHYVATFKQTEQQAAVTTRRGRVRLYNATNGAKITVKNIKLEKGNRESSYTVAPEDTDSSITTAQTTANNAQSAASTAQSTANGIRTDLTSVQSQVTTNKNNIASLTATTNNITASVSSLETKTETITTTVENMKIGARNLFIAKTRTNDKYQKADGTTPTWAKTVMSDYISAEAGETYIAQAWKPANTSVTGDNRGYLRFAYYNASKSLLGLAAATIPNTPEGIYYFTGDYFWFKFKAPTNTKFIRVIYHFGIDGPAGEDWDMFGDFKVKVEHGTKATEWSPAPEDMVDVIDRQYDELSSSFTMTTNQINSSVQQLTNDTTAVQSALNEYKNSNDSALDDINGDIASVRQATELLQSKSEVQASVISELQNSQGKATQVTTTTATLNNSGLTVQKSSSTISTTISENGMQVKNGSTVELSANSQGVVAHNLSADNYLIVDNMIRWQKYGSNRIGCYWIGG